MLQAKTTEREIEFELTNEEREEWRAKFDEAWDDEQVAKAAKADDLGKHNKVLRDIRSLMTNLRQGIKTGKAKKTVECFERRDERLGHVEYVDKTTGQVLEKLTRPMTADERRVDTRQASLLDADGKSVKAKSNGKANGKPELVKEPLKASVADLNESRAKKKKAPSKKGRARPQPNGVA
jgi:hypothetical protein